MANFLSKFTFIYKSFFFNKNFLIYSFLVKIALLIYFFGVLLIIFVKYLMQIREKKFIFFSLFFGSNFIFLCENFFKNHFLNFFLVFFLFFKLHVFGGITPIVDKQLLTKQINTKHLRIVELVDGEIIK